MLEIGGSAIALAVTLILEWFPGSYRQLTPEELDHIRQGAPAAAFIRLD